LLVGEGRGVHQRWGGAGRMYILHPGVRVYPHRAYGILIEQHTTES